MSVYYLVISLFWSIAAVLVFNVELGGLDPDRVVAGEELWSRSHSHLGDRSGDSSGAGDCSLDS